MPIIKGILMFSPDEVLDWLHSEIPPNLKQQQQFSRTLKIENMETLTDSEEWEDTSSLANEIFTKAKKVKKN